MRKVVELVAVGPGGSGVRSAKADRVTGAARPLTFQLFPSLVQ